MSHYRSHACKAIWQAVIPSLILLGCRNLTTVPQPIGVVTNAVLNTTASAEAAFYTARTTTYGALGGAEELVFMSELLTDELTSTGALEDYWPVNSRTQLPGQEPADGAIASALPARAELLVTIPPLVAHETGAGQARVGEAYALVGYIELLLADDYCAGLPLEQVLTQGGVILGNPLTADSLLATAEAHFDSALAYTGGNDTIASFASVGLGRARLERGNDSGAAAAVTNVPTGFVYNVIGETDGGYTASPMFYEQYQPVYNNNRGFRFNVANGKGGVGLDFVAAGDPRLAIDSTDFVTFDDFICDVHGECPGVPDTVMYYPSKFEIPAPYIPLATGVEARLIEAEAALKSGDANTWANDLNALRGDAAETGITFANPLPTDSTTGASAATQIAEMFRERAFWLFGTGTRLGDMRRLLRQYGSTYGFTPNTVFPSGPYEFTNTPIYETYYTQNGQVYPQHYGTDVSLLLPTTDGSLGFDINPTYKGCLSSSAVP